MKGKAFAAVLMTMLAGTAAALDKDDVYQVKAGASPWQCDTREALTAVMRLEQNKAPESDVQSLATIGGCMPAAYQVHFLKIESYRGSGMILDTAYVVVPNNDLGGALGRDVYKFVPAAMYEKTGKRRPLVLYYQQ